MIDPCCSTVKASAGRVFLRKAGIEEFAELAEAEVEASRTLSNRHYDAVRSAVGSLGAFRGTNPVAAASLFARRYAVRYALDDVIAELFRTAYTLGKAAMVKRLNGSFAGPLRYEINEVSKNDPVDPDLEFEIDEEDEDDIAAFVLMFSSWMWRHHVDRIESRVELILGNVGTRGRTRAEIASSARQAVLDAIGPSDVTDSASVTESAVIVTTGRVAGSAAVASRYNVAIRIVNPMDERTCPRCAAIAGTVIPIEYVTRQLDALRSASTFEEYKKAQPWLNKDEFLAAGPDIDGFASAGITLPPYHGKCRCTIDYISLPGGQQ